MDHDIKYGGQIKTLTANSHVDDHDSVENFLAAHQHKLATLFGLSQTALAAATFVITRKPPKR